MNHTTPHRPADLRELLRRRALTRTDLAEALQVSLPTATRYLADPLLLNGYQRRAVAELLDLEEDQLTPHLYPTPPYYSHRAVEKV